VRVLFACSVGGAGHLDPLRPFIESLGAGHGEILLVVPPSLEAQAATCGCRVLVGGEPRAENLGQIRDAIATGPRAAAAVLSERELFGRLCTAAMLDTMQAAFASLRPDLVLREPCEYASAVLAARTGTLQAQVAISQSAIEASALKTAAEVLEGYESGVVHKIAFSPYLTRFPERLDPAAFTDTRRFSIAAGPVGAAAKWWAADERPLVYMTFGSVTGQMPIAPAVYATALKASGSIPARVLLTVGNSLEIAGLGALPDNVVVEAFVPQADVFAKASLVVSHGGSGTTFGALAAGLPQVIVPLFADHFTNAKRVVEAGAGLSVEPLAGPLGVRAGLGPDDAPRIAKAVRTVLGEPAYARAAGAIAEEMASLPSVADVLAGLRAEFDGAVGNGPVQSLFASD
jgi:hypothetical protein